MELLALLDSGLAGALTLPLSVQLVARKELAEGESSIRTRKELGENFGRALRDLAGTRRELGGNWQRTHRELVENSESKRTHREAEGTCRESRREFGGSELFICQIRSG